MPIDRHRARTSSRRTIGSRFAVVLASWASLSLLGCGEAAHCNPEDEPGIVFDIMQDLYFFNDEPAQAAKYTTYDPGSFGTADDLLDVLRYEPSTHDRGFTYITTPAAEEEFFEEGLFVGFGIGLSSPAPGELFIREVFEGSPAEAAGRQRGDRILEIDGRTIAEIEAAEGVGQALGPPQRGLAVEFTIAPVGGGGPLTQTLQKAVVEIDPVPVWDVFDVDGEPVGYLLFHVFIPTAVSDLVAAFEDFQAAGVTKLVVDLRYNGGGFLWLAAAINDLLGGIGHVGEVQYSQLFNSQHASENVTEVFFQDSLALPLDRIVFITTDETASASELVINALRPYRDVQVVGSTTSGKPVGQVALDYCYGARRLRLVAFEMVNAFDEGGYFSGIPADCPAVDDLSQPLGADIEASLATALEVAETGLCPADAASAARASQPGSAAARIGRSPVPWVNAW